MYKQEEVLVFGICEAKNGTEIDDLLCKPEQVGTSKMLKRIQVLEDGGGLGKGSKRLED